MNEGQGMEAINTFHAWGGVWTSGQLSAADLDRLAVRSFKAVINLAPPSHPNTLPGEGEQVTARGISYIQIPVPWEAPTLAHVHQFFGVMQVFAGEKVWVHCAKNMRVTALIYLYRRLLLGHEEEEASHPLREVWAPDGMWRGLIDEALARGYPGPNPERLLGL